ncbi:hypothetical protein IFR05_010702 [Cadophora sp. M221]|nr:hypothetical protein IFR05_010702 [Cadophora sp. M221]
MFLKELERLHEWVPPGSEGKDNARKSHKFDMTYAINGILLLAQHGHFFYVEPDAIADKSKANILAKGLVCVQVLWVAGQAIERKVAGLPISLLEYHTLVHVVCALVIWNEEFPEALGFIVASSRWKGHSGFTSTNSKSWPYSMNPFGSQHKDPEFNWFGNRPKEGLSNDNPRSRGAEALEDAPGVDTGVLNSPYYSPANEVKLDFSPEPATAARVSLLSGQYIQSGLGLGPYSYYRVALSCKDLQRLDLAGGFIVKLLNNLESSHTQVPLPKAKYQDPRDTLHRERFTGPFNAFDPGNIRPYGRNLIAFRAENTAGYTDMEDRLSTGTLLMLFMTFIIILSGYGGIHLAAMHSTFPTPIESTLWNSSCYILLGTTRIAAFFIACVAFANFLQSSHQYTFLPWLYIIFLVLYMCGVGLLMLLYFSARIFIVVESFISLRHMPAEVYKTPALGLTSYIPHI